MPQMANLALNDGASTPVSHTYVPQQSQPIPIFVEAGSTPVANRTISCELRNPSTPTGVYKETVQVAHPVVQQLTGSNGLVVDTVVRILRSKTELLLPVSSTKQERKDLVAIHGNFFLNATAKQVHEDLLPFYG
jgi:hypothetical protein